MIFISVTAGDSRLTEFARYPELLLSYIVVWQDIDVQTHFNWPEGKPISYSIQKCHALEFAVYCFCSLAILLHDGTPRL